MKGIILAAGRGSRMNSKTDNNPKCLIELNGKSLLEYQIEAFRNVGVNKISIVTGYKREMLLKYNLKEFHNSNWENTNMVSSLTCAREWLIKNECIISYSDIYYDSIAIKLLKNSRSELSLTYDPNWLKLWKKRFKNPLDDAESFKIDLETNHIVEIGQKAEDINEIMGQYMGLIKFTPKAWSEALEHLDKVESKEKDKMFLTDLLQKIILGKKIKIEGIKYTSFWAEFDSIKDLKEFEKLV